MELEYTIYLCRQDGFWSYVDVYKTPEEALFECKKLNKALDNSLNSGLSFYFVDVDEKNA